ncbi:energy-coupling factor transporter transmembrane protein EcfT [Clostridium sp.]|uniref:energy-coupling factor transporter transmembrane component T family protein n=1 Tax=Clostridium sp. TaxID=1506 RepID=UPI001A363E06|nr:energy-coupling factor transporter transmembrane component T [Clostridium sp.]MBK5239890.1 energy-coupling factor transporter transmembrane protein EcfT [Clostridium sp.]
MNTMNFASNYEKDKWIHRMDPRVKLIFIISFVMIPLLFTDIRYLLAIALILTPIWISASIDIKSILPLLIAILVFSITAVVFATFYNYNIPGQKILFKLGPLIATDIGFISGLTLGFRSALPSLVVLILICTTDPAELAKAMMKMKMPLTVAFMMLAALRMFPMIAEEMSNISTAQTIRGIDKKGFKGSFRAFKMAAFPLMINSLRRSRTMGLAIESKGFGKRAWKDYYQVFKLDKIDYTVLVVTIILIVASIYIRYGLGLGINTLVVP